jgi:hypothetical protein
MQRVREMSKAKKQKQKRNKKEEQRTTGEEASLAVIACFFGCAVE